MRSMFRSHWPSHGTVVGYLALFVALGGTSYAVATGSIDSREIKNNSVLGKDIRAGTVRGSDVGADALTGADVRESTLGTVPQAGAAGSAGSAATAGDAGRLDGLDSADFLRRNGTAADSELVDGLDSSAFLQNGAAAGGGLSGTYPTPAIATNAVGSSQIANESLRVGDIGVRDFTGPNAAAFNFGSIAADSCADLTLGQGGDPGDLPLLIPPNGLPTGLVAFVRHMTVDNSIPLRVCNITNAPIDPPSLSWHIVIFRG